MASKVYSEMLEEVFANYAGDNRHMLQKTPLFFTALQDIYSEDIPWVLKHTINSCFSYFAIPDDVIPDHKEDGYLDDLFICAFVLDIISKHEPKMVIKHLKNENPFADIESTLSEAKALLGSRHIEILRMVGLLKFQESYADRELWYSPEEGDARVSQLDYQILDLMAVLRSIFISEGKRPAGRKLRHMRELLDEKEWESVLQVLSKVQAHEKIYDSSHEERLAALRRDVILDLDDTIFGA